MKYLQIVNAAVVIFGGSMALIVAVVCILYGANLGQDPGIRSDLPRLFIATGWFTALGGVAAAAFAGHRRHWTARWIAQVLVIAPVIGLALFIRSLA